ncbi:MAG: 2OG-Fe(II) oxygenase [Gammaproteobacteria bacterium]
MPNLIRTFSWVSATASGKAPVLTQHDGLVLPTGVVEAFSQEECNEILHLGEKLPDKPALTGDGGAITSYSRRNARVRQLFPDAESDWIFQKLESELLKFKEHFGFELTGFYEGAQLYRYPEGGFLNWHMDIGLGVMSNRKLAISVQLNSGDEYEGGDLEFEDSQGNAPRKRGTFIIFPAYMRHRVTTVTKGYRDCLVTWVHGPPFA